MWTMTIRYGENSKTRRVFEMKTRRVFGVFRLLRECDSDPKTTPLALLHAYEHLLPRCGEEKAKILHAAALVSFGWGRLVLQKT
jgi:hypothetical protein